jgi:hypothetical protein
MINKIEWYHKLFLFFIREKLSYDFNDGGLTILHIKTFLGKTYILKSDRIIYKDIADAFFNSISQIIDSLYTRVEMAKIESSLQQLGKIFIN